MSVEQDANHSPDIRNWEKGSYQARLEIGAPASFLWGMSKSGRDGNYHVEINSIKVIENHIFVYKYAYTDAVSLLASQVLLNKKRDKTRRLNFKTTEKRKSPTCLPSGHPNPITPTLHAMMQVLNTKCTCPPVDFAHTGTHFQTYRSGWLHLALCFFWFPQLDCCLEFFPL